jgi:hypothetical protein
MGSIWTHAICHQCWNRRQPDKRIPVVEGDELCCFCHRPRAAGIYVRENPAHLACRGEHRAPPARLVNHAAPAAAAAEPCIGNGCRHEPADPDAGGGTLCWYCGAMICYDGGQWRPLKVGAGGKFSELGPRVKNPA